jgi:hypothetical protein
MDGAEDTKSEYNNLYTPLCTSNCALFTTTMSSNPSPFTSPTSPSTINPAPLIINPWVEVKEERLKPLFNCLDGLPYTT